VVRTGRHGIALPTNGVLVVVLPETDDRLVPAPNRRSHLVAKKQNFGVDTYESSMSDDRKMTYCIFVLAVCRFCPTTEDRGDEYVKRSPGPGPGESRLYVQLTWSAASWRNGVEVSSARNAESPVGVEASPGADAHAALPNPRALDPFLLARKGWAPWEELDDGRVLVAMERSPSARAEAAIDHDLGGRLAGFVVRSQATIDAALRQRYSQAFATAAAEEFASACPEKSAKFGLRPWQMATPAVLLMLLIITSSVSWDLAELVSVILVQVSVSLLVLFKLAASLQTAMTGRRSRRRSRADDRRTSDADLPLYTVLVPAFDEANIVRKLIENIAVLDYPAERLQVLLLLEEGDDATFTAVRSAPLPPYVQVLVVPRGEPRTKPRACNFGLQFARGEYTVIFDAEDRPEMDQLRKAVFAFQAERPADAGPVACLQARLHFDNARANVSSNHFRTSLLRELVGWDPYNVTEDADLGLRIAVRGYGVEILDSVTWEEACGRLVPWIRQRTRWIKGYIITAGVYTRQVAGPLGETGARGLITLAALILGTPIAFLAYPALLLLCALQVCGLLPPTSIPSWVFPAALANSALMGTIAMVLSAIAGARRYGPWIVLRTFLNPFYWLLHSFAAYRAAVQAVRSPHRWEKTPHGLTRERRR
jgi:cellulose synthase/poly-beta-1,6-N-acetylglucosamine synthase-like glycosyltransferase